MILCSSVAQIFRVSSPQVSLSISKKSFWSVMYFLSSGSFKMAKNRKKRVNCGHSELIFEWTRPFLDTKFCKDIRKRQGFSKKSSVFPLYIYVFYKKLKKWPKIEKNVSIAVTRNSFLNEPDLSLTWNFTGRSEKDRAFQKNHPFFICMYQLFTKN